jgi:hypothetical protein
MAGGDWIGWTIVVISGIVAVVSIILFVLEAENDEADN